MPFELSRFLPEFPVRESCLYLDHAAGCPLPRSVADAMRGRIQSLEAGGRIDDEQWSTVRLTCRHVGSELIGCAPEDISLIRSTSEGLSLIAEGFDWKPGDEILIGDEEFAANVTPWVNLEDRGVKVIRYPQPGGRVETAAIEDQVTDRTRLLSVSWVSAHSGWIAPLVGIAGLCRERNLTFILDAVQGLGMLPLSMPQLGIDAVVAGGHTWLLGPRGTGLMATAPDLRRKLRPVLTGSSNVNLKPDDDFLITPDFYEDGRRFECGTADAVGLAGLAAALDLVNSVGLETISERVQNLNRALTRILLHHGWSLASPGSGHPIAGIVAGRPPDGAAHKAQRLLEDRHIITSVRQNLVRFSPHFYISGGEMEALERILTKCGL